MWAREELSELDRIAGQSEEAVGHYGGNKVHIRIGGPPEISMPILSLAEYI